MYVCSWKIEGYRSLKLKCDYRCVVIKYFSNASFMISISLKELNIYSSIIFSKKDYENWKLIS